MQDKDTLEESLHHAFDPQSHKTRKRSRKKERIESCEHYFL